MGGGGGPYDNFSGTTGKETGEQRMNEPGVQNPYESTLAALAQKLWDETAQARAGILGQGQAVLSGQVSPDALPGYKQTFALAKQGIENQYGQARENILANTARGGGQTAAIAGLEAQRAQQAGSLPAQISQQLINDILGKIYGAAFGAPQTSIAGMGAAAGSFTDRLAALENAQAARFGAHTSGLANAFSSIEYKQDVTGITDDEATEKVMSLRPVHFRYIEAPKEAHAGFLAEEVPEDVVTCDGKSIKPVNIVSYLTKVVQRQERRIEALEATLAARG